MNRPSGEIDIHNATGVRDALVFCELTCSYAYLIAIAQETRALCDNRVLGRDAVNNLDAIAKEAADFDLALHYLVVIA